MINKRAAAVLAAALPLAGCATNFTSYTHYGKPGGTQSLLDRDAHACVLEIVAKNISPTQSLIHSCLIREHGWHWIM